MEFREGLPTDDVNAPPSSAPGEFATLTLGAILGVAMIVVLGAWLMDALILRLPPDLEQRWFGGVWEAILEDGSVLENTEDGGNDSADAREREVTRDLQALLNRVSSGWENNPYTKLTVQVFDDDDENALALPGGYILVSSALISQAESENEIAFVLCHELGHFYHRDHLRRMGRGLLIGLIWTALTGNATGSGTELFGSLGDLASRGVDREAERAADRFALKLVMAEYGHIQGATAFFDRAARRASATASGDVLSAYGSTHPGDGERIEQLQQLATISGWPLNGPLRPWRGSAP